MESIRRMSGRISMKVSRWPVRGLTICWPSCAMAPSYSAAGWGQSRSVVGMIQTGEQAPDFELPDQDGNPVRLSELRGRPVVLYFYPKADTPGCTTQACGVRDHMPAYEATGAVVLGVSPDPVKAVKKFHHGQGLNFTLLADEDHAVCDLYGVWA